MLPSFESVQPWHWWVLGALLLILEVAAPGIFFVWLALAAFTLGLVVFVLPLPVAVQLLLFAGLSLAAVLIGRHYVARLPVGGDEGGDLNLGASRFVGRTVVVTHAIENGVGRVRLGDSDWRASGPDVPVGATVRVIGADGATLQVEKTALEQALERGR